MAEQKDGVYYGKRENVTMYDQDGVKLNDMDARASALTELNIMQRNCVADYKEWAKEHVDYKDFANNPDAMKKNLKQSNDTYIMSMLMNCLAPLQNGADARSVLSSYFTYKVAQMMNPHFNQDVSRMMSNLRTQMSPMLDNMAKKHPVWAGIGKKLMDANITESSEDLMRSEMRKAEENHDIDDLNMTPRQIAALKLNFMEQHYVDVRQYDISKPDDRLAIERCKEEYTTALQHLNNIAANGGFDMSVVASEERYLVGLKIAEDPNYAKMFANTYDVYGVRPVYGSDSTFEGKFLTSDEHPYTVSDKDQVFRGAFEVRMPIDIDTFQNKVNRRANEQMAQMYGFVKSENCPLPDDIKEYLVNSIEADAEKYADMLDDCLKDDFCFDSDKKRKAWIKENFTDKFHEQCKEYDHPNDYSEFNSLEDTNGRAFYKEFCYVVDAKCAKEMKITPGKGESVSDTLVTAIRANHPDDVRTDEQILEDMRNNYLDTLTSSDIMNVLRHVGTNMEQGKMARGDYGSYDRSGADKMIDQALDIGTDSSSKRNTEKKTSTQDRGKQSEEVLGTESDDAEDEKQAQHDGF